jgi:hypothetical protein
MRIRMVVRLVMILFLVVSFLPRAVWAQGTSGISGVVKDTTGAVLPGVTVEASSPVLIEKVRLVVTDDQGAYRIVNLVPGTYLVTFTLPGFSTVRREGIALTSNFTAAVDADLRVGSIEETVTVSGQSPIIDVENVVRQRVISREVLDALPTNKEFSAFASITVGAVLPPNQQDVGGNKDPILAFVAIHGSRSRDGRQLIDGMNFNGEGAGRGFYLQSRRRVRSQPRARRPGGRTRAGIGPGQSGSEGRRERVLGVLLFELHEQPREKRQPDRRAPRPRPERGQYH